MRYKAKDARWNTPSNKSTNRLLTFLCASLLIMLSIGQYGCFIGKSAGKSLGKGAIKAITKQDSALVALQQQLLDSAGLFLNRTFETAVLDPARVQFDSMTVTIRETTDSIAVLLAQNVSTDLNESIQQLLNENFDLLEKRSPELARNTARALSEELNRSLPGALATVGDSLGQQLVAGLAVGLRDVLEPALHQIMVEVADSLRLRIQQVDKTVSESETLGGLRYTIIGGSLVLVLGIGALAFGYWRRQGKALNALIDAVEARGDPELHENVRSCASEAGVHGWLSDRVTARRKTGDQPER